MLDAYISHVASLGHPLHVPIAFVLTSSEFTGVNRTKIFVVYYAEYA